MLRASRQRKGEQVIDNGVQRGLKPGDPEPQHRIALHPEGPPFRTTRHEGIDPEEIDYPDAAGERRGVRGVEQRPEVALREGHEIPVAGERTHRAQSRLQPNQRGALARPGGCQRAPSAQSAQAARHRQNREQGHSRRAERRGLVPVDRAAHQARLAGPAGAGVTRKSGIDSSSRSERRIASAMASRPPYRVAHARQRPSTRH